MIEDKKEDRVISKKEFNDIISNQIQILQNLQSQGKSILNLTLAIIAAGISLGTAGFVELPAFSFSSDDEVQEAVEGTMFTANLINNLSVIGFVTVLLLSFILLGAIIYGYGKLFFVFKTQK